MVKRMKTAEQIARYNAWRKPLEDSYRDILPALAAKYGATIQDTGVIIITEMVAGTYNLPAYSGNEVTVSVCSPAGNMQIGDYDGWTVTVFDYAIAGAQVSNLQKKGADTAWILAAVDKAMHRGARYAKQQAIRFARQKAEHDKHMFQTDGLRKMQVGKQQPQCSFCEANARAAARAI